jgi:hypothetical protein
MCFPLTISVPLCGHSLSWFADVTKGAGVDVADDIVDSESSALASPDATF